MPPRLDPVEFDRRTERQPNGCLLWVGPRAGRYGLWGRRKYAHHEAYERAHGSIPAGLQVLHSCDTPKCVEPAHLRSGTQSENLREAASKGRMRNQYGPFSGRKVG